MKKEIYKILSHMKVSEDREDAEQKAHGICKIAPDACEMLIELGQELKERTLEEKTKNIIRAVVLTLLVFYRKNSAQFTESSFYSDAVDLLIDFSGLGFMSAKNALSEMGYSEYDIFKKQFLTLPEQEKHRHDKVISTREAFEEFKLSRNYTGFKGFMKDHYALGCDHKHTYKIYRIDSKLFALRVQKSV